MDSLSRKRKSKPGEDNREDMALPIEGQLEATLLSAGTISDFSYTDLAVKRSRSLGSLVQKVLWDSLNEKIPLEYLPINLHARITDENLPCESSTTSPFAAFLNKYHDIIKRQNRSFEETVSAVVAGVINIYADQLAEDAGWNRKPIVCTLEQPCSSFTDLAEAKAAFLNGVADVDRRRRGFCDRVPGFGMFSKSDRESLLTSRNIELQAVHRGPAVRGDTPNDYFHNGKDAGCHPCLFWLRQVTEPRTLDRAFLLASLINDLHLNLAERYIAACIIMFRPDGVTVENQGLLHFLHVYYTDIFRHLVASRPGRPVEFYAQFRSTVEKFSSTAADGDLLKDAADGLRQRPHGPTQGSH